VLLRRSAAPGRRNRGEGSRRPSTSSRRRPLPIRRQRRTALPRHRGSSTAPPRSASPASRRHGRSEQERGRGGARQLSRSSCNASSPPSSSGRLEVVLLQVVSDLLAKHRSLHVGGTEVDASPDACIDDLLQRI